MSDKPNIILIMADQQRADMVASEGFACDTMPFLDNWSREGVRFRRAYTPSPLCVPARVSLFTGRYPKAHRVKENHNNGRHVYKPADDLIDVLKKAGYETALVGKNHSYLDDSALDHMNTYSHGKYTGPCPLLSDEEEVQNWLSARGNSIAREATPFPARLQQPVRIVQDAIAWLLGRQAKRPFFLWLSFPEPHNPSQVSEPYFSMFDPPPADTDASHAQAKGGKWEWMSRAQEEWNPSIAQDASPFRKAYCGMLRLIDDQLKRFIGSLKKRGLYDNTYIVYTSDHGDYAFEYGLHGKGVGLPECLTRVPLTILGPGIKPDDNSRDCVSLTDLFPTLCGLTGQPVPPFIQGRDLSPILRGEEYPSSEFESVYAEVGVGDLHQYMTTPGAPSAESYRGKNFFDGLNRLSMSGKTKMVRKGWFKLIADMMGNRELYDLEADPRELQNLSGRPDFAAEEMDLSGDLLKWTIRTEDDAPAGAYSRIKDEKNYYWRDTNE